MKKIKPYKAIYKKWFIYLCLLAILVMFSQVSLASLEDIVLFDKDKSSLTLYIPEKGLDKSGADEVLGFFKANQWKIRKIICSPQHYKNNRLIDNILLQLIATILREHPEIIGLEFYGVEGSEDLHPGMEMLARALLERGVGLNKLSLCATRHFGDSYLPILDALRMLEISHRGMLQSLRIDDDSYTVKALEAINSSMASFSQLKELHLGTPLFEDWTSIYTKEELKLAGEGLLPALKAAGAKLTHLCIEGTYPMEAFYKASLVSWLGTEAGEDLMSLLLPHAEDVLLRKLSDLIILNRRRLRMVEMDPTDIDSTLPALVCHNFHITDTHLPVFCEFDDDDSEQAYATGLVITLLATKRNKILEKLSLLLTKLQAGVLSLAQHPRIGVNSPLYVSSYIHQLLAEPLASANEVNSLAELKALVSAYIMYPNPEVQKLVRKLVTCHDTLAAVIGSDNLILLPISDRPADMIAASSMYPNPEVQKLVRKLVKGNDILANTMSGYNPILLPVSDRPADMIAASSGPSDTDNSSDSSPSDDDRAPAANLPVLCDVDEIDVDKGYAIGSEIARLATKRNEILEKLSLLLTKLQAGVLSLAQHPRLGVYSHLYVLSYIHQLLAEPLASAIEVNSLEELKAWVAAYIMHPNHEVQKLVRKLVTCHDKLAVVIGDDNLILLPVSDRPADMIAASSGSSDTDNSSDSSPSDDDSAPAANLLPATAGACGSSISSSGNTLAIKNETPKVIASQNKLAITKDSNFTALIVSNAGVEKPRFVENLKAFTTFKQQLNGFFQLILSGDIKGKEFLSELIAKITNSSELTDDQKKELLEEAKRIDNMLSPLAIVSSMQEFITRTEDGFSANNVDELFDSTLSNPHPMALIMHAKYAIGSRNFGFNHLTGMAK